ncbi:HNH endonuclease [Gordonia sp. Z-3]|uniref:HNH endonuclease n=1 Tax=Gordonia sp. Z-3 TaxID=3115408 RepID=UPI002E2945E1|nr:HNH endonuclease [Gordonia sp. Z-3]MED5802950.1 HNH endonuclease [Gordonia sp. Z-3]
MPRAPRQCQGHNGRCGNLIRTGRYCPDCTRQKAWAGPRTASSEVHSTTRFKRLRTRILDRDHHQCQLRGPHCLGHATDVDHIIKVASAPDRAYDPTNLQSACRPCHNQKTRAERDH